MNFKNYTGLSIFNPNQVQVFMMNRDATNRFVPTTASLNALYAALDRITNKTPDE